MENNIGSKNSKIIIVIRHGEREDDSFINKDICLEKINKNDPFLTEKGKIQARKIGEKLQKILINYFNKNLSELKISIESSPFIRTIMTADNLLKGLNIDKENKICVNHGLYEFINGKHFTEDPEFSLIINNTEKIKKLEINLINDNKENKPNYPESLNDCINRYNSVIKKLKKNFENNTDDVLFIITHGYGVQSISEYLNVNEEEIYCIDYCYTYIFSLIDKESKFLEIIQPGI